MNLFAAQSVGRHDAKFFRNWVQQVDTAALHLDAGGQNLHGSIQVFFHIKRTGQNPADLQDGTEFLVFLSIERYRNSSLLFNRYGALASTSDVRALSSYNEQQASCLFLTGVHKAYNL